MFSILFSIKSIRENALLTCILRSVKSLNLKSRKAFSRRETDESTSCIDELLELRIFGSVGISFFLSIHYRLATERKKSICH